MIENNINTGTSFFTLNKNNLEFLTWIINFLRKDVESWKKEALFS